MSSSSSEDDGLSIEERRRKLLSKAAPTATAAEPCKPVLSRLRKASPQPQAPSPAPVAARGPSPAATLPKPVQAAVKKDPDDMEILESSDGEPAKPEPPRATPGRAAAAAAAAKIKKSDSGSSSGSSSSSSGSESSSSSEDSDTLSEAESDDNKPKTMKKSASRKAAPKRKKPTKTTAAKARAKRSRDSDDESDESSSSDSGDSDDEDEGAKGSKGKKPSASKKARTDGGRKWSTLKHNGPVFAPPYVRHNVPLLYDGKPVKLSDEAEEAASFYAKYITTDHVKKPQFRKNFFEGFRAVLKENDRGKGGAYELIKDFDKIDFGRIADYLKEQSDIRKKRTKDEKKVEKDEKERLRKKHGVAIVDGKEQRIANYMVEPPGLFLGRGQHPKTGTLKRRIMPEDVTLNLGRDEEPPKCPIAGHKWKEIVHKEDVTWLAMWKENVMGESKYVWLHASASIKGAADLKKYEKARKLKSKITSVRAAYTRDLTQSKDTLARQRATALYLIDKLALRVGGEKGDDEADTVGCCSLRVEHIKLADDNVVEFDFLGKDSMRYQNSVKVEAAAYNAIKSFVKGKKKSEDLFDLLSTTVLNNYLKEFMDGLSAKVFRTYNATFTLQQELEKTPKSLKSDTADAKVLFYNRANKQVAILCNHQRTVKGEVMSVAMGKFKAQLLRLAREKKLLKAALEKKGIKRSTKTPKKPKKKPQKKKKKSADSDEEDSESSTSESEEDDDGSKSDGFKLDEDEIKENDPDIEHYRAAVKERERLRAEAEEREAKAASVKKEVKGEDIKKEPKKEEFSDSDSESSDDDKRKKKKAKKTKDSSPTKERRKSTVKDPLAEEIPPPPEDPEKIESRLSKVESKIRAIKLQMAGRSETSTVALGTSKINYMDPRVTVAWCKRVGLPLEKIFAKTLRDKFSWALEAEPDFVW